MDETDNKLPSGAENEPNPPSNDFLPQKSALPTTSVHAAAGITATNRTAGSAARIKTAKTKKVTSHTAAAPAAKQRMPKTNAIRVQVRSQNSGNNGERPKPQNGNPPKERNGEHNGNGNNEPWGDEPAPHRQRHSDAQPARRICQELVGTPLAGSA